MPWQTCMVSYVSVASLRNGMDSANLTLANLSALKASSDDGGRTRKTKYTINGQDRTRIKDVLKSKKASNCRCKREWGPRLGKASQVSQLMWVFLLGGIAVDSLALRCWKLVSFQVLLQVCLLFWSFPKPGQDALLWSLQSNGIDGYGESDDDTDVSSDDSSNSSCKQRHVKWFIGGTRVCRRAFIRMLGVGCKRLNRTRDRFRGLDERCRSGRQTYMLSFDNFFESPQESRPLCNLRMSFFAFLSGGHGPRSSLASASVQLFMQKMYYSISESMPTGLLGQQQKVFLGSCSSSCVPASWQTEKPRHVRGLPACWQPLLSLCASQLANRKAMSVVCQLADSHSWVCVPASWQTEKPRHVRGLPACWQPLLSLCASQLANRKAMSVVCQLAGNHSWICVPASWQTEKATSVVCQLAGSIIFITCCWGFWIKQWTWAMKRRVLNCWQSWCTMLWKGPQTESWSSTPRNWQPGNFHLAIGSTCTCSTLQAVRPMERKPLAGVHFIVWQQHGGRLCVFAIKDSTLYAVHVTGWKPTWGRQRPSSAMSRQLTCYSDTSRWLGGVGRHTGQPGKLLELSRMFSQSFLMGLIKRNWLCPDGAMGDFQRLQLSSVWTGPTWMLALHWRMDGDAWFSSLRKVCRQGAVIRGRLSCWLSLNAGSLPGNEDLRFLCRLLVALTSESILWRLWLFKWLFSDAVI